MKEEIKEILDKLKDGNWYNELDLTGTMWIELSWEETHLLLDYITNLQEENERLHIQLEDRAYEQIKFQWKDLKQRNEKANWWLKEMLKQAKSDETKAIINGTLDLLLQGSDKDE